MGGDGLGKLTEIIGQIGTTVAGPFGIAVLTVVIIFIGFRFFSGKAPKSQLIFTVIGAGMIWGAASIVSSIFGV